jgi:2-dehydro-3-deoxygluconokinase
MHVETGKGHRGMKMATGVASIGECMLELSPIGEPDWRMGFAGDTLNTLWAMRAVVPSWTAVDYVTAFGDDPFSAGQRKFLADHEIGIASSPTIRGGHPGLYAITLDGADRSFTYWRSDSAARRLADDERALAKSLENKALVYFSGITLAILETGARGRLFNALRAARRNGSRLAFDPNYRERLWPAAEHARNAFAEAFDIIDIALPTFQDEQCLHGDSAPGDTVKRLTRAGIAEIVVKNGAEPALVVEGEQQSLAPAIELEPVDTTGAGDAFNGGYLAARLMGDTPLAAAGRAHRVAAATVNVRGALAPYDVLRRAYAGRRLTPDMEARS